MQVGSSNGSMLAMLQKMQQQMQTNFTAADSDGNGKLSKTEFAAFDTAMKAAAPNGGKGVPSAEQMFGKMDSDGDDAVTMAELTGSTPPQPMAGDTMSALLQMGQEHDKGKAHAVGGIDGLLQKLQEAFTAADSDGDGKLSKTEFASFDAAMKANDGPQGADGGKGPSADEMFGRLDTNGDGSVTLDEIKSDAPPPPPPAGGQSAADSGDALSDLMKSLLQQMVAGYSKTEGSTFSASTLLTAA